MNIDRDTLIVLSAVVIALVVALAAWLIYRERQSQRLKARFGPEYGRAVEHLGSRTKAESELKARETRVERLRIVPLSPADAERFAHESVQRDDEELAPLFMPGAAADFRFRRLLSLWRPGTA